MDLPIRDYNMDDIQQEPQSLEDQGTSDQAADDGVQEEDNPETPKEEPVVFDDRQQAVFDGAILKKVEQRNEETQKVNQLRKENEELKSQIPEPITPDIPPLPNLEDFYDDQTGYNEKMKERDAAIAEHAEFNAQQTLIEKQQAQYSQQKAFDLQKKQVEQNKAYVDIGLSFGIDLESMDKDGVTVVNSGISPHIQDFILEDKQGPLITSYLVKNAMELETLRLMSPLQAAAYIATDIRPKLAGMRKETKAPPPVDLIDGKGAPKQEHPTLKGAVYK